MVKKCDRTYRFVKLVYDDNVNRVVTRRCLCCGDLVEEALKKTSTVLAEAVQGIA